MRLIRNQLALGVAVGITLLQAPALAGSYHSASVVYGPAQSHDDPYQGHVLWMEFEYPNGDLSYGGAVMLNEWYGITAAHNFTVQSFLLSNHVVGTGDNYLTSRGQSTTIQEFGAHSSWSGTLPLGNLDGIEVDLAWFRVSSPIHGAGVPLGTAQLGDVLTVPEFGNPATGNGGFLPIDGERRAFDAVVDSFGFPNVWSSDYLVADFLILVLRNLPMAGMGTPGSSGSPWFNDLQQVVGITSSQLGTPDYFGQTGAVDLAPHHGWIIANTQSVLDCPGDADGSRAVDLRDFAIVQQTFGQLGAMFSDGDVDHDDDVDFDDVTILIDEMGTECP